MRGRFQYAGIRHCFIRARPHTNFFGCKVKMKNYFLIGCAVFLLASCTSMGKLESAAPAPAADETVFVIGIAPETARISVFPGEVSDRVFRQSMWRSAVVMGNPDNGFIVGKAKAGDVLAITNVRVVDKDSLAGTDYVPCGGARTLVFTVPAGKVVYLGHIRYELVQNRLRIKTEYRFEDAQTYINATYANLRDRLERQDIDFDFLPTTASCRQTVTIPIYIPRAR